MTVPSKRIVPSLWPWPLTYEGKLLFSELSTILYVSYIHFRSIYLLIAEIKYQNIDLHLEFDEDGKLLTRLYDKRGDFDFPIVNYPYLSSNIPESPAYGVFVSPLIRYARVCSKYEDFLFWGSILVSKLLKQGYSSRKFQTIFRKLYGRHTDLVHKFDTSVTYDWFPVILDTSWRVPHVG